MYSLLKRNQQKDKTTTHLTHTQLRHHFIFRIQNHRHRHRVGPTRNRRSFQFSTFRTGQQAKHCRLSSTLHRGRRINTSNHKHSSFTKPLISEYFTKEEGREAQQSLVRPVENGNVVKGKEIEEKRRKEEERYNERKEEEREGQLTAEVERRRRREEEDERR
ncbi:hypothetical protein BLNAU_25293 [Blattamonas nauphoetae]|uniref:Uncharacterized protein n=1 Tax=Blattamonas nauphoetae TaxID=2049346 RepID=A0ABQ9WJZ5_9EUKA|nr:hypothetical protein BLNAU_25293 [Blattamonas nauphoetae]